MKRLRPMTAAKQNALAKLVKEYGQERVKKLIPIVQLRGPGRPSLGNQPERNAAYFSIEVEERAAKYRMEDPRSPVKQAILDVARETWPNKRKTLKLESLQRLVKAGRKYRRDHPHEFD
jgi:hypothetical protein